MTGSGTPGSPAGTDRAPDAEAARRRRVSIYSSPAGRRHFRRASDALLAIPAVIVLALLVGAYPPSGFEQSLSSFLEGFPSWLDPVWGFLYDLLGLWAAVLLVAALAARRWAIAFQALGALVLAAGIAVAAGRLATGEWAAIDTLVSGSGSAFPAARAAESAAVILAVAPHLVRPLRTLGRRLLVLGAVGALFATDAVPGGVLAAIMVAVVAAAGIRLAFGTSVGRPELSDIRAALAELGVRAGPLEEAERQVAGVVSAQGRDRAGRPLLVKVYGRDAYDSQLLAKLWRSLWFKDTGPPLRLSRAQSVEHEAFATLLARDAGVPALEVVTAGATREDDAVLVLRGAAEPLAELTAEALDDRLLGRCWRTLALLEAANIAHLRIDPSTVVRIDGEIGLVDFSGAQVAPTPDQLMTDRAQLLAASAAVAGTERAIAAAVDSLGADGVASLLPYLQSAAFGRELQRAIKAAGLDVDEFRARAAEGAGVEPAHPIRLHRVTPWSLVQAGLLVLAVAAIISFFSGIDLDEVGSYLADASWAWLGVALVVAQLPRVAQAVATLGSVPARLPFGPVYAMQLAVGYLNLALPSALGRMAINIRFFQRQALSAPVAVTSGVIDSFASTVVQGLLLVLILVFSESSLSIDLSAPDSGGGLGTLLWILVAALALVALVSVLFPRLRRAASGHVRRWLPEVRSALGSLRASNKLLLLFLGNIATEVLFAVTLGLFVYGIGYQVALPELLLINMGVSLLSTFIPVPGGIGVSEFGLTLGLTSAGVPEEAALAAVLLYRIATFYLPPVWGFFAMRWLQRNHYL